MRINAINKTFLFFSFLTSIFLIRNLLEKKFHSSEENSMSKIIDSNQNQYIFLLNCCYSVQRYRMPALNAINWKKGWLKNTNTKFNSSFRYKNSGIEAEGEEKKDWITKSYIYFLDIYCQRYNTGSCITQTQGRVVCSVYIFDNELNLIT